MRGARNGIVAFFTPVRIIPADAGSTDFLSSSITPAWDHPRRCGEHGARIALVTLVAGSSPQMRGALFFWAEALPYGRIIPADAGSTTPVFLATCTHQDHPRRCGEHRFLFSVMTYHLGSSPQMRGAPAVEDIAKVNTRIIPADAGSTLMAPLG